MIDKDMKKGFEINNGIELWNKYEVGKRGQCSDVSA